VTSQDCKFDFIRATVKAEHPEWSETRILEQAVTQAKLGSFGRPTKEAGAVLIAQVSGIKDQSAPAPKPDEVVAAYTHPFAAEAERRGKMLVYGGWYVPLPGVVEGEE
jgi:hypothetical protein